MIFGLIVNTIVTRIVNADVSDSESFASSQIKMTESISSTLNAKEDGFHMGKFE